MHDSTIALRDGRALAFTDIGDPAGAAVFFFHGAPTSRLRLVGLDAQFAARGLRVVSADRPGYGGSSPQPGRTMADWPRNVEALADALGIARFCVAGHSSGGPYAVACCALLGERVAAGLVLAGVTDMAWPEAWEGFVESEARIMRAPDERAASALCAELCGADGSAFFANPFDLPDPDALGPRDDSSIRAMVEAFRQGVAGYAQDCWVQARPWPFDPSRITVPVEVLHGERDTLLPIAHSRHTAELIPGAALRTVPGHDHLTILTELPSILSAPPFA